MGVVNGMIVYLYTEVGGETLSNWLLCVSLILPVPKRLNTMVGGSIPEYLSPF